MTAPQIGQALLESFEDLFVINLSDRVDRRRQIDGQLRRIGLSLSHPRVRRFDAARFTDPAGFPTAGTRGCFHSHLGVWREALRTGARAALLLEDDVDFAADIVGRIPTTMKALAHADWQIFYGGVLKLGGAAEPAFPTWRVDPNTSVMGGHFIAMHADAIALAVPYLEAMLDRVPGDADGGPMHVDGAYSWFRRAHPELETRIAEPELGHQRPSRTDIHALSLHDRLPGVRQLAALARKAKRAIG